MLSIAFLPTAIHDRMTSESKLGKESRDLVPIRGRCLWAPRTHCHQFDSKLRNICICRLKCYSGMGAFETVLGKLSANHTWSFHTHYGRTCHTFQAAVDACQHASNLPLPPSLVRSPSIAVNVRLWDWPGLFFPRVSVIEYSNPEKERNDWEAGILCE